MKLRERILDRLRDMGVEKVSSVPIDELSDPYLIQVDKALDDLEAGDYEDLSFDEEE